MALISRIEPKRINEALKDESWILAMKEDLDQLKKNQVWTCTERPKNGSMIGTIWVFQNKLYENGKVIRDKARLVSQGY